MEKEVKRAIEYHSEQSNRYMTLTGCLSEMMADGFIDGDNYPKAFETYCQKKNHHANMAEVLQKSIRAQNPAEIDVIFGIAEELTPEEKELVRKAIAEAETTYTHL